MSTKTVSGYTADTIVSPKKYLIPTKAQSMNFEIKVIGIKREDEQDFENDGLYQEFIHPQISLRNTSSNRNESKINSKAIEEAIIFADYINVDENIDSCTYNKV